MCVPNVTDTSDEEKARLKQLQTITLSIQRKGLLAQLDSLRQNKNKSLIENENYLTAKQYLEKMDLENWYKLEKIKLTELGATKKQMLIFEKTYTDEIELLHKKQIDEDKTLNKKWNDEKKQAMQNQLENKIKFNLEQAKSSDQQQYSTDYSDEYGKQLAVYQDFLQQKLAATQKWSDEYVSILQQLESIKNWQNYHDGVK